MLTTKRQLLGLLNRLVNEDAPIMLKLKGESREFPLDVTDQYILDGALHLQLDQSILDVGDEGVTVEHNYIDPDEFGERPIGGDRMSYHRPI